MIKTQTQIFFFFNYKSSGFPSVSHCFSMLSYLCVSQEVKWPRTRDRQDINLDCIENNRLECFRIKVNEKRILRFERSV